MSDGGCRKGYLNFTRSEEKLVPRLVSGAVDHVAGKHYQRVDCDHLLSLARETREVGRERRRRVEALQGRGRASREAGLLRRHREVWERENSRLREAQRSVQAEIEFWKTCLRRGGGGGGGGRELKSIMVELMEVESEFCEEREQFEREKVEPLRKLTFDLKGWIKRLSGGCAGGGDVGRRVEEVGCELEEVGRELEAAKQLQKETQALLESDLQSAHTDIAEFIHLHGNMISSGEEVINRGIPAEALSLECPDKALREAVLTEFRLLDDYFQAVLDQLEERNRETLSLEHGGWSQEDAWKFAVVVEQYPSSLDSQRALVLDRLTRELSHKSRADIV